ncbi:MAG: hypothetical protein P4L34_00930 [Paludibacter sp.]|nr:hypothetical protein [Paludibacter sp.]
MSKSFEIFKNKINKKTKSKKIIKITMDKAFKIPPKSPENIISPENLVDCLRKLIGVKFKFTGKPRTDGSSLRKLIARTIFEQNISPEANAGDYEIMPPRQKGVPRLIRELIDTYIVTTGESYNLQVWNRVPNSNSILVNYTSGDKIQCKDIRLIFIKVNTTEEIIESIIVLTPEYIEKKFGKFGKPTIKHQLMISNKIRDRIIKSEDSILTFNDTDKLTYQVRHDYKETPLAMLKGPDLKHLFSIQLLLEMTAKRIIGITLEANDTKNRGQALERLILQLLGYSENNIKGLAGGYPDIPNQLLEVKVQDSPTVDLGKYSPEFEDSIMPEIGITTKDIRYLIALTNAQTGLIEGVVLVPGEKLGEVFTYVSETSYKCQRSIPMAFFEKHKGQCVFNP